MRRTSAVDYTIAKTALEGLISHLQERSLRVSQERGNDDKKGSALRKSDKIQEQDQKGLEGEDEDEDEDLCSICYTDPCDTLFVPCSHKSCSRCIARHLIEHKNCFFCKTPITSTSPLSSE